eukprot:505373_1
MPSIGKITSDMSSVGWFTKIPAPPYPGFGSHAPSVLISNSFPTSVFNICWYDGNASYANGALVGCGNDSDIDGSFSNGLQYSVGILISYLFCNNLMRLNVELFVYLWEWFLFIHLMYSSGNRCLLRICVMLCSVIIWWSVRYWYISLRYSNGITSHITFTESIAALSIIPSANLYISDCSSFSIDLVLAVAEFHMIHALSNTGRTIVVYNKFMWCNLFAYFGVQKALIKPIRFAALFRIIVMCGFQVMCSSK